MRHSGYYGGGLPPLGGRSYERFKADVMREVKRALDVGATQFDQMSRQFGADLARTIETGLIDVFSPSRILRKYDGKTVDVSRNGLIRARIGSSVIDRYGDCIVAGGIELDEFRKNPVVLWAHGEHPQRGQLPIGTCEWIGHEMGERGMLELIADVKLFDDDEFCRFLSGKYQRREMGAWSVNVLPDPTAMGRPTPKEIQARPELKDVKVMCRRSKLVEFSACGVGVNPQAHTLN